MLLLLLLLFTLTENKLLFRDLTSACVCSSAVISYLWQRLDHQDNFGNGINVTN